jgi:hypothetical protein
MQSPNRKNEEEEEEEEEEDEKEIGMPNGLNVVFGLLLPAWFFFFLRRSTILHADSAEYLLSVFFRCFSGPQDELI